MNFCAALPLPLARVLRDTADVTQRYKLIIEYDGTPFVGWQRQANGRGVQQVIAEAIHRFCGETVTVYGAGRTDTGVHALGQVAHIDLDTPTDADTVRDALNHHLKPDPVAILTVCAAPARFDARFSATQRHYLYRIINRRAPLTVDIHRAWHVPVALDAARMHAAAQLLTGHHDFTTFRAAQCQAASPVKTLDALDVERAGESVLVRARARSFLHHQVRSLVGTLKAVGEGRTSPHAARLALDARDRSRCGPVAPAHGLYLTHIDYG